MAAGPSQSADIDGAKGRWPSRKTSEKEEEEKEDYPSVRFGRGWSILTAVTAVPMSILQDNLFSDHANWRLPDIALFLLHSVKPNVSAHPSANTNQIALSNTVSKESKAFACCLDILAPFVPMRWATADAMSLAILAGFPFANRQS